MDKLPEQRVTAQRSPRRAFQEYAEAFAVALIAATIIRAFFFQAFEIPSGSMEPTLLVGDHLIVNEFIYGIRIPFIGKKWLQFRKPRRGDVVVFVYPEDRSKDFIKRVIGVAGDTVEIRDKIVFINGQKADDPHAHFSSNMIYPGDEVPRDNMGPIKVPDGALFVMGDNRDNSYDSRFWGFVPLRDVLGEAFVIYFSSKRLGEIRWSRFFELVK